MGIRGKAANLKQKYLLLLLLSTDFMQTLGGCWLIWGSNGYYLSLAKLKKFSIWGRSVHFAKFPILRFSNGYCFHSFHSISSELYDKCVSNGEYRLFLFFAIYKKKLWHFEPVLEIYTVFIWFHPNVMRALYWLLWWNTGCYLSWQSAKL